MSVWQIPVTVEIGNTDDEAIHRTFALGRLLTNLHSRVHVTPADLDRAPFTGSTAWVDEYGLVLSDLDPPTDGLLERTLMWSEVAALRIVSVRRNGVS